MLGAQWLRPVAAGARLGERMGWVGTVGECGGRRQSQQPSHTCHTERQPTPTQRPTTAIRDCGALPPASPPTPAHKGATCCARPLALVPRLSPTCELLTIFPSDMYPRSTSWWTSALAGNCRSRKRHGGTQGQVRSGRGCWRQLAAGGGVHPSWRSAGGLRQRRAALQGVHTFELQGPVQGGLVRSPTTRARCRPPAAVRLPACSPPCRPQRCCACDVPPFTPALLPTLLATVYSSAPCALGQPPAAPAALITSTSACLNFGFFTAFLHS